MKEKTKSKQQAAELRDKITSVILDGSGIRRRVEAFLALPVKYPRNDGVRYDPAWQDEGACHGLPDQTGRGARICERLKLGDFREH